MSVFLCFFLFLSVCLSIRPSFLQSITHAHSSVSLCFSILSTCPLFNFPLPPCHTSHLPLPLSLVHTPPTYLSPALSCVRALACTRLLPAGPLPKSKMRWLQHVHTHASVAAREHSATHMSLCGRIIETRNEGRKAAKGEVEGDGGMVGRHRHGGTDRRGRGREGRRGSE